MCLCCVFVSHWCFEDPLMHWYFSSDWKCIFEHLVFFSTPYSFTFRRHFEAAVNTNDKTWNVEFNIKESQPSHIMITWHPTFDIAVYVDDFLSVKSYTSTNRNAQTSTSSGKLYLGRDLQVNKHFGNITIDELQMWDSVVKNDSKNSTGLLFS